MPVRSGSFKSVRRPRGRQLGFECLESRQLLAVTTFSPVADTYTQEGVNAGSAEVLDALDFGGESPGDHIVYIRFDLSGVDLSGVESATLSLSKIDGTRNDTIVTGRFDVYGLTNAPGLTPQDWNETTLAEGNVGSEYTNTSGNGLDTSQLFNLDQETGADVTEFATESPAVTGPDVLAFITQRINDNGLVTFITEVDANIADTRGWGYGSRENTDPSLRPILLLETAPSPYPENPVSFPRQMEQLDRGIVAVRSSVSDVYVGWRLLGNDPTDVAFNLYRSTDGGPAVQLNGAPLTQTTDFVDMTANTDMSNEYFVRAIIGGIEQDPSESFTLAALSPIEQYLSVPLDRPAGGQTPDEVNYTYSPNDASVGDLDGDGDYEIVLKWNPSNAKDNSQTGYTGNVYMDAYDFDGQGNSMLLWRIDLGINIRAGAHYTQFLVYDFDGDGRAEVVMKTAPGTKDGLGDDVLLSGDDPNADYRNSSGRILTGPEYLTVFDGMTGAALSTVPFSPPRGSVAAWGDTNGNRVDRFLTTTAYLDGVYPSIIMARGYYAKTMLTAYDYRDGQLAERWTFDSDSPGNAAYAGQGNHNLSVGDVDGDGKDEIVYGAATIDDDGTGLYSTGFGHGDAMHFSDLDPTHPGLEVFEANGDTPNPHGIDIHDAATGEALWSLESAASGGVPRALALDIDPEHLGYELWSGGTDGQIHDVHGNAIAGQDGISTNFGVWWDADPLRELLDGTSGGNGPPVISKWRYDAPTPFAQGILTLTGTGTNNGTKANPSLSADILGDWREEIIVRSTTNDQLRIYTTTIPSTMRVVTLMHDPQYREAIAWQNTAYNQPPHPSFFLGAMDANLTFPTISQPSIFFPGDLPGDYNDDGVVNAADYTVYRDKLGTTEILPNDTTPGMVTQEDYAVWVQFFGTTAPPPAEGQAALGTSLVDSTSAADPAVGSAKIAPQVSPQVALAATAAMNDSAVASVAPESSPSAATFTLPNRFNSRSHTFVRARDVALSQPSNDSLLLAELRRTSAQIDRPTHRSAATVPADSQSSTDGELHDARDNAFGELELSWRARRI